MTKNWLFLYLCYNYRPVSGKMDKWPYLYTCTTPTTWQVSTSDKCLSHVPVMENGHKITVGHIPSSVTEHVLFHGVHRVMIFLFNIHHSHAQLWAKYYFTATFIVLNHFVFENYISKKKFPQ
jgi:hypothetical protein